jgi:hypothetical protein
MSIFYFYREITFSIASERYLLLVRSLGTLRHQPFDRRESNTPDRLKTLQSIFFWASESNLRAVGL